MTVLYDFELDVKGTECPFPLISTKQLMSELPNGAILKVLASDSHAWKNIYDWTKDSGNELIGVIMEDGCYNIYLRKPRQKIVPKDDPLSTLIESRDISWQIKLEELKNKSQELEQGVKVKSEFISTMSHELRTPLNAILGFSELLKLNGSEKTLTEEKQKHYVDNILISAKHLLNLINDILDLSKIDAGKVELHTEKISVPVTIEEVIILIKGTAAKHNVVIKKDLAPELDFIEADMLKFRQVLFNLLGNAVKFSKPEGGIVTISAKKIGDMAEFSVADTGIGIKQENMGKLFQSFEQLDSSMTRNYGGTGLGLAITKKLVELHDGKIWAESKYSEGTTFIFLLPIHK